MKYFKMQRETSFQEQMIMDLLLCGGGRDEDPLDYLLDEFRGSVRTFLEEALRAECDIFLGFGPYERGTGRTDSRNGYWERGKRTPPKEIMGILKSLFHSRTSTDCGR